MSISVEGQKCPVCHGYMFDDEDIAFCPVCGAPAHRECYNRLGHCALEQYHGTDMQYKRPEQKSTEEHDEQKQTDGESTAGPEPVMPPEDEIPPRQQPPFGAPFGPYGYAPGFDALGGVNKNERVEDVSAEELRDAVVVNTPRYIPKFFRLSKMSKSSWNWAAFLIPEGWFFYRKSYKMGFLALVLSVCSSLLMLSPITLAGTFENPTYYDVYSLVLSDPAQYIKIFVMVLAGFFLSIIYRIIFGIFADWIYRGDSILRVKKIRDDDENEYEDYRTVLRMKGGVNPILGLLAIFGVNWLVAIFYMLL